MKNWMDWFRFDSVGIQNGLHCTEKLLRSAHQIFAEIYFLNEEQWIAEHTSGGFAWNKASKDVALMNVKLMMMLKAVESEFLRLKLDLCDLLLELGLEVVIG